MKYTIEFQKHELENLVEFGGSKNSAPFPVDGCDFQRRG